MTKEVFPMRIIFASDVHSAFRRMDELLKKSEADLYLIAGDLVSRAFYRYRDAWRLIELQHVFAGRRAREESDETLEQLTQRLIREGRNGRLSSQAHEYLALCGKAEAYLQSSYERLEGIFALHSSKRIYVLPGNYDMDLRKTALRERSLHLRCIVMDGWRVAGYGGADVMTPGMPEHLQVPYHEGRGQKGVRSEALDFFRETGPDILVLHQPPYGYLDYIPGFGHAGSPSIREYLEERKVKIVLSGHHHDQWGALLANDTAFFNPSNFGRTVEVSRARSGGFFLEITAGEEKGVEAGTLRQWDRGRFYDVLDYRMAGGLAESVILDEQRYAGLGGKTPRVRHISAIRRLRRLRSFFLGYETPETRELIHRLRGIYREIRAEGMEVAFDLLGSLSFGMARESSDMDLVVYMRGRDCVPDEEDTCGVPRPLAEVFKALEARDLRVEVCDSLDLDRVRRAIEEKDADDGQLQRFVFYRLVCRPVNLRLIKRVENLLLGSEALRREVEKGMKEYLRLLVSSARHVRSFEKYRMRLRERGIPVSADIEAAIRNYLRG